ncbi:MAG: hypothetical protein II535_01055, partial [Bacteroidales bacterium]|nr:hypothetical protein [Bacteroidales bacterium]
MTTYYSVDSIIDGMGNSASFEYNYLVHNPMKNDNIFSLSDAGQDLGLSVYGRALPIRAASKITEKNLYSDVPESSVSYSYNSALIHTLGRGFLGFAESTSVSRLAGTTQARSIREFSTADMTSHPFAVLKHEMTFSPFGVLSNECSYTYKEYQCSSSRRNRVFFPALESKTCDSYDVASGDIFGRKIENNTYVTNAKDTESINYTSVVALQSSLVGSHPDVSVNSATSCEFQTSTVIQYMNPNANDWVMRRPLSVLTKQKRLGGVDPDVQSLTVYEYGLSNPFLVSKSTVYPNADADNTNGLATSVSYEYDAAGNVTRTTLHDKSHTLADRTTEYEYEQFKSKKLERNALGDETRTFYSYYWELRTLTDCNGLVTQYWNDDHFGSTDVVQRPDGTRSCSARRWAFDSDGDSVAHAPAGASYYTWDMTTDETPVIVFYDASERELRTVTEDIQGQAIYHDRQYDGLGRVAQQWEPYYAGQSGQHKTRYRYDSCHRLDTVYYPNGTFEKTYYFSFAGLSAVTKEFHANNGSTRTEMKKSNLMGWTTESVDNSGATVFYYYYPDGKLKKAGLNPGVEIQMQYDDAGNRTDITDPDYGHQHSTYNAFGELVSTTTPKGDVTEYRMDVLGRVVKRYDRDNINHTIDSTLWVYGRASGEKGLLKSVNYNNGKQAFAYSYDALCRPVRVDESRDFGRPYQTSYTYSATTGRINQTTYPTGYVVKKEYQNGRLWKIKDAQNNLLWETLRENANGQIVKYKTGNLVVDSLTYNDTTRLLTNQYAKKGSTVIQNFTYSYDDFRNLASRKEGKYATPMTETFKYDNLDRLDTVLFNNTVSRMEYDTDGNMTRRTSQGVVVFKNASVDSQARPHAVTGAEVNSAMLPDAQTVLYTMHDKVKRIEQGDDYLAIDYGYDRQRIGMSEWIAANQASTHKLYVGSCEFNRGLSREQRLTYISGPLGVFAVYEQLGELYKGGGDSDDSDDDGGDEDSFTGALYYLHRDHLGSVTTITNSSGAIVQELSYDAWGNLRNPYTWSGSFTGTPKFDRGFTGHEHHSHFGLINMNGRMYDPLMCSFLSVDTYVQDPENPQNFNRYAYCLNNPLKYVDPSGEFIWVIPNIGYSKDGGLSFGLTFAVGLPGLWSAQASVGYATGSQSIYGSVGATFAGVTAYASAGYSFQNEQVSAS